MGISAAILAGVQMISGIASSYSQSKAIQSQANYQAQQLDFNSRLADLQAKDSEIRGKKEAEEHKTKVKQLIGSQRAALASQGIEVNDDSALELQLQTKEYGAVDALTIRNNAFREATGYRIQAIDYAGQANMTRIAGKAESRNTLISGGLSALNQGLSTYAMLGGLNSKTTGYVTPGKNGYGKNTPSGVYNTGKMSVYRVGR